jgi:hypothetical protein
VDELRQALHAAVNQPPATAIDLDQLIAGEQRRARWRYRAGAAGCAAVLVAGGLLAPTLLSSRLGGIIGYGPTAAPGCTPYSPGSDTPWPTLVPNPLVPEASRQPGAAPADDAFPPVDCTGTTGRCPTLPRTARPQPSPPSDRPGRATEDCADAVVRLSVGLAVAMGEALPGWGVMASVDPGNSSVRWVFLRQADDASPDGYVASLNLAKGSQTSFIRVVVSATGPTDGPSDGCAKQDVGTDGACAAMPDGDLLITRTEPDLGVGPHVYRITDVRPDGTTVEVLGNPPLSQDQLTAIARAGSLTLFP